MSNYKFKLKNVRLSFPSIFKRSEFNGQEGKFEATFLISKEQQKDLIKEIEAKIALIQKDNKAKVSPDKICFKDGDSFGAGDTDVTDDFDDEDDMLG